MMPDISLDWDMRMHAPNLCRHWATLALLVEQFDVQQ